MRLGHHITQQSSAHEKLEALGAPRETTGMESQQILKIGSRGLQQAAPQAVGAEEKRGEAVQTVQRTDWLWEHESSLGDPRNHQGILRGGKAVSQAGGGLYQHNLYFQAGDI